MIQSPTPDAKSPLTATATIGARCTTDFKEFCREKARQEKLTVNAWILKSLNNSVPAKYKRIIKIALECYSDQVMQILDFDELEKIKEALEFIDKVR